MKFFGFLKCVIWTIIANAAISSSMTTDINDVGLSTASTGTTSGSMPIDVNRFYIEMGQIKTSVNAVTSELDKFHTFYMKTLESKILQIYQTMTNLDAGLKALQERAHVWDIFQHHIQAWSDHMHSVDKKIDLIKRTQDTSFPLEAKLSSMDVKSQYVFEKVDLINEKMHDMLKIMYNQKTKKVPEVVSEEDNNLKDIKVRLTNIEKQITMIQGNHCKNTNRKLRNNDYVSPPPTANYNALPVTNETNSREFRQILAINKKTLKNMEHLSDYLNDANERYHHSIETHFKKMGTCCRNNEARISALTSSVESAFQKIEKICLNLEKKITTSNPHESNINNSTIEFEEPKGIVDDEDESGSGAGAGSGDSQIVKNPKHAKNRNLFRKPLLRSCHDLEEGSPDGVYKFGFLDDENDQGRRFCTYVDGKEWTVIQRRGPFEEVENFNRSWNEYKKGFGALDKDFWLGNDLIHKLTNEDGQMMLRIDLEDFQGNRGIVQYKRFYVGSERNYYRLDLDGFDGNITDSFLYHNAMYFSTWDHQNDNSGVVPCAASHGAGWWFNNCLESNLNGKYHRDPYSSHFTGIIWEHWLGDYSLKSTRMMVRPANNDLWINDDENEDDNIDTPLIPPEDP